MTAHFIDGKTLAQQLRLQVAAAIEARLQQKLAAPGLAVILVGNDPASELYVKNKQKACEEVGIVSQFFPLPATVTSEALIQLIHQLNNDRNIHGILLQLPLPSHLPAKSILEEINPKKDVDGFHPYNVGLLVQSRPMLRPCTPHGVILLLESIQQTIKGRHAVVVGASNVVGRPMALELLMAGATVTVCHRFTESLENYIREADIVVSAVGKPGLIKGDWIKSGATVIDVGINRLADGTIVGDVEFDVACKKAAWITPVPGGVGPMTVAVLLKNTLFAAELSL